VNKTGLIKQWFTFMEVKHVLENGRVGP